MSEHEVAIIKDLAETVSQLDSINKKLMIFQKKRTKISSLIKS